MPHAHTRDLGRDGHTDALAGAHGAPDHGAAVPSPGTIGTRQADLDRLVRTRHAKAQPLVLVSEAGPCGDGLDRSLRHQGYKCWGVAPARIPQPAGDRVTADRREAGPRARLMRSGDPTPVEVPPVAAAAGRARTRARDDARHALNAATFRLNACLRRPDLRYPGRATGSPAPLRWLSAGVWPTPAPPIVFQA